MKYCASNKPEFYADFESVKIIGGKWAKNRFFGKKLAIEQNTFFFK